MEVDGGSGTTMTGQDGELIVDSAWIQREFTRHQLLRGGSYHRGAVVDAGRGINSRRSFAAYRPTNQPTKMDEK